MPDAQIRTLQVRPIRSADLCFNMPGIITDENDSYAGRRRGGTSFLGATVTKYDIDTNLYSRLGTETNGLLDYNSTRIDTTLAAPFLFSVRNEPLAATLDQAILRHHNAYLERFKHKTDIQNALSIAFTEILAKLAQLKTDAQARYADIEAAIDEAVRRHGRPEVIKDIVNRTITPALGMVNADFGNSGNVLGDHSSTINTVVKDRTSGNTPVQEHNTNRSGSFPFKKSGGRWDVPPDEFESQRTVTDHTEFFHSRLNNKIDHSQLQVSLLENELGHTLRSLSVLDTAAIIDNESAGMTNEVRRLQLNFAHTYLTSPLSGVVTAVYKDVGESVNPGEPVLRVEDDQRVLCVGRIVYNQLIRVGQVAIVKTEDIYEAPGGAREDFPGEIAAIRGHDKDNDEWEVVIECPNRTDGTGNRMLPLNYHFDRKNTVIEIRP